MLTTRIIALCLGLGTLSPAVASARPTPLTQPAMLAAPTLEGTVNLNTATGAQLELLPGVGPATAAKVLAYRERHAFRRVSHLLRIKGIGKKTFARLRPYLAVAGETTLRVIHASRPG